MGNAARLRALTRAERRVLRTKIRDRTLSVRIHRRYRVIAELQGAAGPPRSRTGSAAT